MTNKKFNLKKTITLLVILVVSYSFLPLIPFWFMKPAPKSNNNQTNVEKLENNKGAYFSFIVFGDNHNGLFTNDASTLKLIWNMNREDRFRKVPIDFVLNVGDVTLDGSNWDFKAWKKMQKLIKYPVIAAIGNHDDRELFREYCGDLQFAFSNRNSYFIIVDNEGGTPDFKWLEEELKKGQEYAHIFIAMHKPPFDPCQQEWYNIDNAPWAYKFRKMCAKYGVDIVFTGHKHMFKREEFDGVENIVTGGGGMLIEIPEADGGYLHYVRVMVNHDYVTYEVRKISPPLWLHITYYLGKETLYWMRNWYGSGYILGRNTKVLEPKVKGLNNYEYWFDKKGSIKE
ncbi:metallophosphoesterase [Patescibacteria group bacterium]|nr:metallophosphoesterase [Candidatus Omnitrophota bacterium]MBU1128336.1 metallophosphoesterase [Candidatus Omnitrophota bacterium]MBU1685659.1 metallophosphoesterase [Patescibacteria group bacterium]MBU1784988.1 metallophosphoesterase [Candidatus Omnitrophota bacterium]MBU1851861.1 metallophosphoesterase [Candidatus Omnitrophota bacterium]